MIKIEKEFFLHPLSLSHAQVIYDSIDKSRPHLRVWLPFVDDTRSVVDTRSFIKSVLSSSYQKPDLLFEIWVNKKFAGLVGYKEIDRINKKVELGYWLDKDMTGKGIMLKSTKAIIENAFTKMNMNRIMIKVAIGNTKSSAIPESLGFQFEGIERNGELLRGEYIDLNIYSLLKKEWSLWKHV